MKLSPMKAVIFGVVIGILTTTSITVFGISLAAPRVEAWLQTNQINIVVDGRTLDLAGDDDSNILNFNGRVHVPVRYIAESLGAEVMWDEPSQTIFVTSPPPEIIEIEVPAPAPVPVEPVVPPPPSRRYDPLPMRRVIRDISINVVSMEFYRSQTEVIMDIANNSQWPIIFLRDQTYIEFRGERYLLTPDDFDRLFSDSRGSRYEREGLRMRFAPLPVDVVRSGDNIDEIRLVIGVEVMDRQFFLEVPSLLATFEFNIDATDERFFNF
ncbi:MAG: copper amine oxidase N-terminal domain-containing protein [Defluviitaleaceae bacterium]|nr:copper amine oxidase N-terminal domain-containing protein [Defluviitaleaceae bacterium]